MCVKRNQLFAAAHVAEHIALRVNLHAVKPNRAHFLRDAVNVTLFLAALARDSDEVAQELRHVLFICLCCLPDLFKFHDEPPHIIVAFPIVCIKQPVFISAF